MQIQPVNADIADSLGLKKAEGALVAEPQADGPAAKAGIQAGDVITAVNGEPVKDARDLAKQIGGHAARRQRQARPSSARARRRPSRSRSANCRATSAQARADDRRARQRPAAQVPRLGLSLAPAGDVAGAGSEGVVVTQVDPDGPAADAGLQAPAT